MQAEYWHSDTPDVKTRNPPTPVNASDERLEFFDDRVTSSYVITLVVFENGLENIDKIDSEINITVQHQGCE